MQLCVEKDMYIGCRYTHTLTLTLQAANGWNIGDTNWAACPAPNDFPRVMPA